MRLKKLEIYGFKSFADRVEMIVDDGVTGVVGPNGSGKSNIGDAVRWVLGEQSARTLRGAKMEDVIFGGTEKRRPQAYCEVSLTFDNADGGLPLDYAEVMITRRVYRNGDSEYYINKSPCRLRDIVDMMRDTGIGKEGYSLIGQGRIDEILSVKSEDRRNVFEEAAGVTKYKARKSEAERRLENTAQNMARVEDILDEIGGKLPSLEKQADAAREYMKLTQELRQLELSSFAFNYDRLNDSLEQTCGQLDSLEKENMALQQRLEELASLSREKEQSVIDTDARIASLHERIVEKTREAEIFEGDLNVLRERILSAKREIERLESENRRASEMGGELQLRQAENAEKKKNIEQAIKEIRNRSAKLEQRVEELSAEVSGREKTIEQGKEQMIRSLNALSNVRNAQARLTAMREALQQRLDTLSESETRVRQENTQAKQAVEAVRKDLQQSQGKLEAIKAEHVFAMDRSSALQGESQQLSAGIQRAVGAQREAQSRLKMLEQMARDYEGYQNSVREVLRRFNSSNGMHGVVADILSVPKEYERAVEMALGGAMQNIVCSREEDAKVMIDALRVNRLGRATFLPISSVRGRVLNPGERQVLSMDGCLGVASELVQFKEPYRQIVENLLGRTVIARDLEAGIAIMRAGRHAFRLVTLEGDVMHSGGSMTGGSVSARSTSILSRQREIAEHRAAVKTLDERVAQMNARLLSLKNELSCAQQAVNTASERVHQQDIAVTREQERLSGALERMKQTEQQVQRVALEREQLCDSLAQIAQELDGIERRTVGAEQDSTASQDDIARLSQELALKRTELEEARDHFSTCRAEMIGKEAELESICREEKRYSGEHQEMENAVQIRSRSAEALRARLSADESGITEKQNAVKNARDELAGQDEQMQRENTGRDSLRGEITALSEETEKMRKNSASVQESMHRLQIMQSRWSNELKQLQERIWERYELTIENARPFALPDYRENVSRSRIDQLLRDVRRLGPVNVGALQEYEETRRRFDELDSQRRDLNKARTDLEAIISELEEKMKTQFTEQFHLLNKHFSETFTRLFGGGTARLQLQNEEDVLNCGIDIVAQPPGKKLQLLSLLSGGERALTAIAILFAMLEIRPSPFCILDEIEAALDEANVANFADYLKEYSRNTQFIVVTHRKGTMERCDALYGVAMEEKGVSRMVSVQLSELEDKMEEEKS